MHCIGNPGIKSLYFRTAFIFRVGDLNEGEFSGGFLRFQTEIVCLIRFSGKTLEKSGTGITAGRYHRDKTAVYPAGQHITAV